MLPAWRTALDAEEVLFSASAPAGQGSTTDVLVWSGTEWSAGADNIYPAGHTVSTYTALDQAVEYVSINHSLVTISLMVILVCKSTRVSKYETDRRCRSFNGCSGLGPLFYVVVCATLTHQ